MEQALSLDQVFAFRLDRSLRQAVTPLEAASRLCGVQAQLSHAAAWALRTRAAEATQHNVESALCQSRQLVKTWLMRGTVHLIPSNELGLYLAAIGPSAEREIMRWLKTMGLSPAAAQQLADVISEAVQAQPMTRKALADAVEARTSPQLRALIVHAWGGAVKLAAIQGHLCFGPPAGQEITFVSREAWLGKPDPPPDQHEALSWLLRRYLACYGPATPQDFSHWSGSSVSLARRMFAEAKLAPVRLPSGPAWLLKNDEAEVATALLPTQPVLLECFDPLALAHAAKDWLMEPVYQKLIYRKAGWVSALALVDGLLHGTWTKTRKGRVTEVTMFPFKALSKARRSALEQAVLERIPDAAMTFANPTTATARTPLR